MSIVFYVYMNKDLVYKHHLEITVCVCLQNAYLGKRLQTCFAIKYTKTREHYLDGFNKKTGVYGSCLFFSIASHHTRGLFAHTEKATNSYRVNATK